MFSGISLELGLFMEKPGWGMALPSLIKETGRIVDGQSESHWSPGGTSKHMLRQPCVNCTELVEIPKGKCCGNHGTSWDVEWSTTPGHNAALVAALKATRKARMRCDANRPEWMLQPAGRFWWTRRWSPAT